MIEPYRGYIRTINKRPAQRFANGERLLTLEEVESFPEYAGILNGRYTVKDVDDGDEARRLYAIVRELDLNCRVTRTTRGMHFMFASSRWQTKGMVHGNDALGLTFDARHGENQYVVLKSDGKVREILRDFDETRPVTPFPHMLARIRGDAKFTGLKEGDGRNERLFTHVGTLLREGFGKDEVRQILDLINRHVMDEGVSDRELGTIMRDETFEHFAMASPAEEFSNGIRPERLTESSVSDRFSELHRDRMRYSEGLGWLVWDGRVWNRSNLQAEDSMKAFVAQLEDEAERSMKDMAGRLAQAESDGDAKAEKRLKAALKEEMDYFRFTMRMGDANHIFSILRLSQSRLEVAIEALDSDPFLLNTPEGTVDLRTGESRAHDSADMCTKMTTASPSDNGMDLWQECLDNVTGCDAQLQTYLKVLAGSMAIGRVYQESLTIAAGDGANGKSTFFNSIAHVLGDYAGKIPAEALTTRARNVKVDLAELVGKRFVLASETEEGQRLSTSMLKQIASVDRITAERKYHNPFTFTPSHTTVLYTNHLPAIGSNDRGTWRRIAVAPFNASITNPKRDFAERLLREASGAILRWMVEGARMFIEAGYTTPRCDAVDRAVEVYRKENDWIGRFLDDCCTLDPLSTCSGGTLYRAYRMWALENGENPRRGSDFANALKGCGFTSARGSRGMVWRGLEVTSAGDGGGLLSLA